MKKLFLILISMFLLISHSYAFEYYQDVKILSFSSEEPTGEGIRGGRAIHAFDNNVNTIWHSEWKARVAPFPHEIVLDLNESRTIKGFSYLARQDTSWNGTIKDYQIFITNERGNWGNPISGTLQKVRTEQILELDVARVGRLVKFVAVSEIDGGAWASAAEIKVLVSKIKNLEYQDIEIIITPSTSAISKQTVYFRKLDANNYIKFEDSGNKTNITLNRNLFEPNENYEFYLTATTNDGVESRPSNRFQVKFGDIALPSAPTILLIELIE